jgi:hypothetical protein
MNESLPSSNLGYKIIGGDGREYGPVTADQVRDWVRQGRANAQTLLLAEGSTDWKPLGYWTEFTDVVGPVAVTPGPQGVPPLPSMPTRTVRQTPPSNPMAVTALVMGLLAVGCCGPVFGVLGVIFSLIAFSQIKADPAGQGGKGMAVAGLACSIAGLVISLAVGLVWLLMFLAAAAGKM